MNEKFDNRKLFRKNVKNDHNLDPKLKYITLTIKQAQSPLTNAKGNRTIYIRKIKIA